MYWPYTMYDVAVHCFVLEDTVMVVLAVEVIILPQWWMRMMMRWCDKGGRRNTMEGQENDVQTLLKPKTTIFEDFFVFVLW